MIRFKKILVKKEGVSLTKNIPAHKNRIIHMLKNKFFIFKKWKMAFFTMTDNLSKHFLLNLKKNKDT